MNSSAPSEERNSTAGSFAGTQTACPGDNSTSPHRTTPAVHSAIAVAFGGLGLHRLQAEVKVGNDASVRVLERCGFTEYGLARDYLRLGGDWADCRLFQLVDPHWQPGTEPA